MERAVGIRALLKKMGVDWINLAQGIPVAGSYEHSNESLGPIKVSAFYDYLKNYSFSKRILLHGISVVKAERPCNGPIPRLWGSYQYM